MSAPNVHEVVLPPLDPGHIENKKEVYKHLYEIWKRTGGYTSQIPDLKGLKVSVIQLNTLIGIKTDDTVQQQLDTKANTADLGDMAFQESTAIQITGGTLDNVQIAQSNIASSDVSINFGQTGISIATGGTAHVDTTQVGCAGGIETDLMTYILPAFSLAATHQYLEVDGWGTIGFNANNKRLRVYFGSAVLLDTGSVAANGGNWSVSSKIVRTGTSAQKTITTLISDNSLFVDGSKSISATESTLSPITIRVTGEGVAVDDLIQLGLIIKWFKV